MKYMVYDYQSRFVVECEKDDIYNAICEGIKYGLDYIDEDDLRQDFRDEYELSEDDEIDGDDFWDFCNENGMEWFPEQGAVIDLSVVGCEPVPPNTVVGRVTEDAPDRARYRGGRR